MPRIALSELSQTHWDVVIIGAGCVGSATARELAARGFKTLLLDRADIGSGTSARSSRTLYCGVGYLAPRFALWQMPFHPFEMWQRFSYTRNIMQCRAELVRDMPQRLSKHRFYYPFRPKDQYPHWLISLGFNLMERVASCGVSLNWQKNTITKAKQESELVQSIGEPVAAIGSLDEYMYQWPERICVDTALDAELRGATIRTYTQVERLEQSANGWQLHLSEQAPYLSGDITISAKAVVNAAGPWLDRIAGSQSNKPIKRIIGKKGVNLMVKLPDSWQGQGLEAFSSKGEPFYVFPWGKLHFIGPTELETDENPDTVRVLETEVDYILGEMNWLFPRLKLTRSDVHYAWCGVRPMSTKDGKTISLPVRAMVNQNTPHLISVTGSYIMMHRHAARLAASAIEKCLGKRGSPAQGMRYQPLSTETQDAITHIIQSEHVVCLADLIRRRLPDGLSSDLGVAKAENLSYIAAQTLGWDEMRRCDELKRFAAETDSLFQRINNHGL